MGAYRSVIRLQQRLAADHQHQHHNHYFSKVFLIQNTQNRDSEAIHIKLDELIRVSKGAQNALFNLEELEEE